MLKYTLIIASLLLALPLVMGCDDRGTGITRTEFDSHLDSAGAWAAAETSFATQLTLQLRNPREQLLATAYVPAEAIPIPPQQPIPLLILLAPEGGTKWHYFNAGLEQLVKDLTASGEIQPMVIYCVGNDQTFGGYFYGDSDPGGHYDAIFDDDGSLNSLIRWLHFAFPATIENSVKRGIGGVGQGAYGAFRAAIKHPGLFHSISVADGPLDFDGFGNGGLMPLFDDAVAEQQAFYLQDPAIDTVVVGVDTSFNVVPFNFNKDFDSSYTMPLSMMFIGGAFAFSPNDTLIDFDRFVTGSGTSFNIVVNNMYSIADPALPGGGDSTTLITNIVKPGVQTRFLNLDFHLPFDANGQVYAPIWNRWMANNLDALHGNGTNVLGGMNMWIGTNPNAKWNYHEMTRSWLKFLSDEGYQNVTEYNYSGYAGDEPVVGDEYLFDILREMLIFHSQSFGQ